MAIIDLAALRQGDTFEGITLIRSASLAKTKAGNDYVTGQLTRGTTTLNFKVWDSATVGILKPYIESQTGLVNMLAQITGEVRTYNNAPDYTISSVQLIAETPELKVADFLPSLDCDKLWQEFSAFVNAELAPNYIQVLITVMKLPAQVNGMDDPSGATIQDKFKTCWAASGHHDAIGGGLLNHTLKMLRYAKVMMQNNANIAAFKDIIYLGIMLHDIGKTQEIDNGVYTKGSFITHNVMGVEYLARVKNEIVAQVGIEVYTRLCSIIIGHHDKFGTPAATVWARVIHLIDMLDAHVTEIEEYLVNGKCMTSPAGDKFIYGDDNHRLFY